MTGHGGVSCPVALGRRLAGADAVGRRTKPARSIYTHSQHLVMILAAAACQCFVIYKCRVPRRGRRERGEAPPAPGSPADHLVPAKQAQSRSATGMPNNQTHPACTRMQTPRAFAEEQSKLLAQSRTSSISRGPGATHQFVDPHIGCSPVCTAAPSTEPAAGTSASRLNETPLHRAKSTPNTRHLHIG